MKKIIYLGVFVVSALLMISCEKDEIGGTATENVAGEWKRLRKWMPTEKR